ncbi:MAG: hypothetical protein KUG65_06040 [Sphingomonadaceae bacterium]|nr:hypothetical protein [Sphingomonadaceae bacterium]
MNCWPQLRWRLLTSEEKLLLGCPVRWEWEALEFTWFSFGLIIEARMAK